MSSDCVLNVVKTNSRRRYDKRRLQPVETAIAGGSSVVRGVGRCWDQAGRSVSCGTQFKLEEKGAVHLYDNSQVVNRPNFLKHLFRA